MKVAWVAHAKDALVPHRIPWIRHVLQQGQDVVVLFPEKDRPEDPFPARVVTYPYDRKTLAPHRVSRSVQALKMWWREEHPRRVHAFSLRVGVYMALAMGIAARQHLVVWFEGLGSAFLPGEGWRRRIYGLLGQGAVRWLGHRVRAFVVLNPEDRRVLHRLAGKVPVFVFPGVGLDVGTWHPARCREMRARFREAKGVPGDAFVVLYAGRMIRDKGICELKGAMEELVEDRSLRLWLVGHVDPANPSALSSHVLRAWMEEDPRIRWWGYQSPLLPWLCAADVVVLPSYREGLPRLLLEALALEKPVVATDVPGNRLLVHHEQTGLLVPPRDPVALAMAIHRMMQDRRRAEAWGRRGRAWVSRTYALPRVLEALDDLHRTLGDLE